MSSARMGCSARHQYENFNFQTFSSADKFPKVMKVLCSLFVSLEKIELSVQNSSLQPLEEAEVCMHSSEGASCKLACSLLPKLGSARGLLTLVLGDESLMRLLD